MCGIVGIFSFDQKKNVVPNLIKNLTDLQHRGQLSAGLSSYNKTRKRILQTYKENGKVDEVFKVNHKEYFNQFLTTYAGNIAIGHTRYATSGSSSDLLAQPFERPHGRLSKWFSICFNGNLANYTALKHQIEKIGYNMTYDSDTEIIMHYVSRYLQSYPPSLPSSFPDLLRKLHEDFDGAWNLCFINAQGNFFASRDPYGFHPLCYGIKDDMLIVASESNVLSNMFIEAHDIPPGHVLVAKDDTFSVQEYYTSVKKSHCFFEYIYFANIGSTIDDVNIYKTRQDIGLNLTFEEDLSFTDSNDWIVVPVPDTSSVAASTYANTFNLPLVLGIIKNHQVGRTFITGENRQEKIRQKFSFIKEILSGKKVVLIDDSIVRGSTLKELVSILKDWCNVDEVHLRIGCPPIISPCFYGIDFPTRMELYAGAKIPNHDDFNADSLKYVSLDGLLSSIAKDKQSLCLSCLNKDYPTACGIERYNSLEQ